MGNQNLIGLDELMIVNPGQPGTPQESSPGLFLGEDGKLYQVKGAAPAEGVSGLGEFYLGDDGNLYQLHGLAGLSAAENGELGMAGGSILPRFFLGEDGTLYEVRKKPASPP